MLFVTEKVNLMSSDACASPRSEVQSMRIEVANTCLASQTVQEIFKVSLFLSFCVFLCLSVSFSVFLRLSSPECNSLLEHLKRQRISQRSFEKISSQNSYNTVLTVPLTLYEKMHTWLSRSLNKRSSSCKLKNEDEFLHSACKFKAACKVWATR